jgi:hypothetical protein
LPDVHHPRTPADGAEYTLFVPSPSSTTTSFTTMAAISNKISQITGVGKGKLFVKNDDDVVVCSAVRTAITKVCGWRVSQEYTR